MSRVKRNINWGDLRKFSPVSKSFGFDRGNPVDRYYVELFLQKNADLIRGNCLELLDSRYIKKFGSDKVTSCDILDIDTANKKATLIADLTSEKPLGERNYDCIICTQALYLMYDVKKALQNLCDALKVDGWLLITVPFLVKYSPEPLDCWRFTEYGLRRILEELALQKRIEFHVESYGNLITCVASLQGLAVEDLKEPEFAYKDDSYPLVICAKVKKLNSKS